MNPHLITRIWKLITIGKNQIFIFSNLVSHQYNGNMKKQILLIAIVAILSTPSLGQYKLSGGGGYYGHDFSSPGFLLEFEYEKFYKDDFSAPLRADLSFFSDPDYNALVLDVHKGFRKHFSNGLFVEQSVGMGLITTFYKDDDIVYYDKYTNAVFHYHKAHFGLSPSVTLGIGYDLTHDSNKSNLLWIRPKVYWNLGLRPLNLPFYALQVGYTHNFKSK